MAIIAPAEKSVRRELTWEEYLRLPEITQRYEIIEGVLVMSPASTSLHQWIMFFIAETLSLFVKKNRLGVVLPSPIDVIIRKTPKLQTRQPDILFLSTARTGVRGLKELKSMPQIHVAPDLIVEILSPQEEGKILRGKLQDYAAIGVAEAWLVRPKKETVEVMRLENGAYEQAGLYRQGETLISPSLPGFTLAIAAIFEE